MEKLQYKTEVFEGPLDLLLHLISKHKLDIYDIPIFELVEQYIAYVRQMQEENMEVASEFLEMAARLVYIKSVSLLPVYDEALDLKKELTGELIEYRDCKLMAAKLSEQCGGINKMVREPAKIQADMTYTRIHEALELYAAYMNAAGKKLKNLPPAEESFKDIVERAVVSVSEKIDSIYSVISRAGKIRAFDIFSMSKSRSELVASFLALLEMAKDRKIVLIGEGEELEIAVDLEEREAEHNEQ
ncbi:MAG: segregation/condensation protein A [Clostridiales bacterium]|nr:segregation/condensation protein A [Clostridiales bacterium]MCD7828686.1 segregation/condensation protein A [Clostridiales bacterium]